MTTSSVEAGVPGSTDPDSQSFLDLMAKQESLRSQKVAGVRTILVMLSSSGMVFDIDALRQKILLSYPEAAVFFRTTDGKAIGSASPDQVDLLLDFTAPGSRQGLFYAKRLRRMSRVAVGRNVGLFRARIYDRVFDEKARKAELPGEKLSRERVVQREVLALAGIPFVQAGTPSPIEANRSRWSCRR